MRIDKAELFAELAKFFKGGAGQRATILTIEDLHWADPSTLEFLDYFFPRIASSRLMLVATYRSEELELRSNILALLSSLLRQPTVHEIRLQPLAAEDTRAILHSAPSSDRLSSGTMLEIERRCDGNPFFAEELLKSAVDQPSSRTLPLPLSIRASVLQRFSLLGDDDRRILGFAAVMGVRFDPSLLALAMKREVDAVLPALHRARALGIIVDDPAPRQACRFRHALTREAVYGDMLAFDTQRLHRAMLEQLEMLDAERYLPELAHHAWEAKLDAKALVYNERAGEAALALGATADAAEFFQRALSAAVDEMDTVRLLERAAVVAEMRGDLGAAVDLFESALSLRVRKREFDEAAKVVCWIVSDRSNLGDNAAADYGERFLEQHWSGLSGVSRDNILALCARLKSAASDFEKVDQLVARLGDPRALEPRGRQNYLIARLNLHAHTGDLERWKQDVGEFQEVLAVLSPYLKMIALLTIAQTGMHLGGGEQVSEAFHDVDTLRRHWTFGAVAAFGAAVRASYQFLTGDLTGARRSIEFALGGPEVPVTKQVLAQVGPLLGLALGDDALALRCMEEALLREARAEPTGVDTGLVLGASGQWLAARGRMGEAQADLRLALEAVGEAPPACGVVLVNAARFLDIQELPRIVELSTRAAQKNASRVSQAHEALVHALSSARRGEEADEPAMRAAALYETLGWPLYRANALELAGKTDEALAIYERSGASGESQRLAPAAVSGQGVCPLSARELEIAQLVTLGLTNAAIAERLAVGSKTVEKHLSSIFEKLAIRSRAQIAAYIARQR